MHEAGAILFDLFIIYAVARLAGELFERLRQPAVIGELLAGAAVGPYGLGLIGTPNQGLVELFHGDPTAAREALDLVYTLISELGVVVLLFTVGLETRLDQAVRVGGRALAVAVAGVAVPFALGFGLIDTWGTPGLKASSSGRRWWPPASGFPPGSSGTSTRRPPGRPGSSSGPPSSTISWA